MRRQPAPTATATISENPALPEACERAGIVFIGPPASAMRQMGSKTAARDKMSAAGVDRPWRHLLDD